MFSSDHVLNLNNSWSGPNSLSSMLQNSTDSIEMFLEDYFHGNIDQTELETRTDQIVGDIILCMEEFLSCLVPEQAPPKKGLSSKVDGSLGTSQHEGWNTMLVPEDWQSAWKQPFRGKSLDFLKRKLALNVDALKHARRSSRGKISKLEMSRIIPIIQSSGTGKSRLAEEYDLSDDFVMPRYVKDQFAMMLSLKNGHGFPDCVSLLFISLLMKG